MAIRPQRRSNWCPSWTTLAFLGILAVAGFLLLAGLTDGVFAVLPFLLVLACPLMHLFMHGGHGNHGHSHGDDGCQVSAGGTGKGER